MKYQLLLVLAFFVLRPVLAQQHINGSVPEVGFASNQGTYRLIKKLPNTYKRVFYFQNTGTYIECKTKVISILKGDEQLLGKAPPCEKVSNPHASINYYQIKKGDSLAFVFKEAEYNKVLNAYILTSAKGQRFYLPDSSLIKFDAGMKSILTGAQMPREGYFLVLKPEKEKLNN